jgi:ribosomal protein S18 acetylase RimI-like enzyme
MGSPVQPRSYIETDLDEVLALCGAEGWTTYSDDPVRAHGVFSAPGVVSVVATSSGAVIGFAYFQTDGAIQAHLSLLVVSLAHRREGVARELFDCAATRLGAIRVDLITDTAETFYRSLPHKEQVGFRIYPGTKQH